MKLTLPPNFLLPSFLLLTLIASTDSNPVFATQTKTIELAKKDSKTKAVTIRVNAQRLLIESGDGTQSTLFTSDGIFTINNRDKTYSLQTYSDLKNLISRKVSELNQSSALPPAAEVELKITGVTETISGFETRRLIKTNKGVTEAEFWVSRELVPSELRALGDEFRKSLPESYWASVRGNPGIPEIVLLFGVPLRITHDKGVFQARVVKSPATSLRLPPGYQKLDN